MPRTFQKDSGMTRVPTENSPKPSFGVRTMSAAEKGFTATNLTKLSSLCEECAEECRKQGLTDKAEECDRLKDQCESARGALESGAVMATDWMAFAMLALQMLLEFLKQRKSQPEPS